jgi:hypothetical protein
MTTSREKGKQHHTYRRRFARGWAVGTLTSAAVGPAGGALPDQATADRIGRFRSPLLGPTFPMRKRFLSSPLSFFPPRALSSLAALFNA